VGIAYLLWFLSGFGGLGLHRYYLGKIPTGLLWTCTWGLAGFGGFYDFFTLPAQVREANLRKAAESGQGNRRRPWRYAEDGEARVMGGRENLEHAILKLARKNRGILTAAEAALEAGVSIDDAKRSLDALVSRGFAELRVRRSGTLAYTIPEFMDRDDPLEDF
jgi:hypothetical protein